MTELERLNAVRYLKAKGYVNLYVRGGCKVPLEDAPDRYLWSMYNRVSSADTVRRLLVGTSKRKVHV